MYEWYEEAFESYAEECEEVREREALNAELRSMLSEATAASSSSPMLATTRKVSRKEEHKVNVPPWPKVNDLGLWKANLIPTEVWDDPERFPEDILTQVLYTMQSRSVHNS